MNTTMKTPYTRGRETGAHQTVQTMLLIIVTLVGTSLVVHFAPYAVIFPSPGME